MPPLQAERDSRGDEIDQQKGEEVSQQLHETRCRCCFRMIVPIDEVVNDPRQKHLEDQNIRQRKKSHRLVPDKCEPMFPYRLQNAEGPAKALSHKPARVDGRFCEGESTILVNNLELLFE